MSLLLDTHVLLWWGGEQDLSAEAFAAIANPDNMRVDDAIFEVGDDGFEPLPITHADARMAGSLPDHHRDPFDRMLIAQALARDLRLVTRDSRMELYEASILPA